MKTGTDPKGPGPPDPKKKKKKLADKLGIKIMFGAFGPLQEHINRGPSPTRKDTRFNLIPNNIYKKKKNRETDEHQPQPQASATTHRPRRRPLHSDLPNFEYLLSLVKPNTNVIYL